MKTQEEITKQTISYVNATSQQLFKYTDKLYKVFVNKEKNIVFRCDMNLENITFIKVGTIGSSKKHYLKYDIFKSNLIKKGISVRHFRKLNEIFKNIVENYKG